MAEFIYLYLHDATFFMVTTLFVIWGYFMLWAIYKNIDPPNHD